MRLGLRAGTAILLTALVAFGAAARPAHAGPTYGPAAEGYIQLQTTRDALAYRTPAFTDPYVRQYLNTAISLLDDALLSVRWNSTGLALNGAGEPALEDMRWAAMWLAWADAGLNDATVSDQRNIVWSMGQVALGRFHEVYTFVGEGGGPDPWATWASWYALSEGNSLLQDDYLHASLSYINAWQYLRGQPPCC
jgi:hypothetical protein